MRENPNSDADQALPPQLPALLPAEPVATPLPRPRALLPERSDFLVGDEPAAHKVEAFLSKALATITANPYGTAHALVPWMCDVLQSKHSLKAYQGAKAAATSGTTQASWFGRCEPGTDFAGGLRDERTACDALVLSPVSEGAVDGFLRGLDNRRQGLPRPRLTVPREVPNGCRATSRAAG